MAHLRSSVGLGNRPQKIKLIDDTRTAVQAGPGALRYSASGEVTQVVTGVEWTDISKDPDYTAGGNFIGDGSDG